MASPLLKLLLAVFLMLSPPASALSIAKSETAKQETADEEECGQHERPDDNGKCCVGHMMTRDLETGDKVCAEEPSTTSVCVAFTLISSFTFLISLQFFMNYPDEDMQKYAYTVISATVSIFSAVLMFQSVNGLVETLVIEPLKEKLGIWIEIFVDFLQMLTWYIITQLAIAHVTRALKPDEWREEQLALEFNKRKKIKEEVKVSCVCWGMIVAHLTGFASINFWTSFQQIEPFKNNPVMSLIPVIFAVLGQALLQLITDACRAKYAASDGVTDWFEKRWQTQCEEAENDIMGLTVSVIGVNSCRYLINSLNGHDCLPNSEQKEEGGACDFDHSMTEVCMLLLVGLLTVITLFLTKLVFDKVFPDGEEEGSESESASESEEEQMMESKREKTYVLKKVYRATGIVLLVLSMGFSWCIFHGFHQLLVVLNPSFLGKAENVTSLAVVNALLVTYLAALIIRILDAIADLPDRFTPKAVDDSIKQVIKAMSLFIGFAWEQTFDDSIDSLARKFQKNFGSRAPAFAKVVIGTICIAVVFVSWKRYILPYVVARGWTPGYIHNTDELETHFDYLSRTNKEFKSQYLDKLKMAGLVKVDDGDDYKPLAGDEGEMLKKQIEELKQVVAELRQRRGNGTPRS